MDMTIKDSGERRDFGGAMRDMSAGKGRFDLLELDVVGDMMGGDRFFLQMFEFQHFGATDHLIDAATYLLSLKPNPYNALLDLAKHAENGCIKYGENNWKSGNGIPISSYVDSACRHYCKFKAGWEDEPHYIACLWNLMAAVYTADHMGVQE